MSDISPVNDDPHFEWTSQRDHAVVLIAQGKLTWTKVAEEVGCDRTTLYGWYKHPVFKERVEDEKRMFAAEVRAHVMAETTGRLASLYELRDRILRILEEREAYYEKKDKDGNPGAASGLLAEQVTITEGAGNDGKGRVIRKEFKYESALARDLMALEKQIAQELGQWSEKQEVALDGPPVRSFTVVVQEPQPFSLEKLNAAIDGPDIIDADTSELSGGQLSE